MLLEKPGGFKRNVTDQEVIRPPNIGNYVQHFVRFSPPSLINGKSFQPIYPGKPTPSADHESVDIRPPSQPIPRIVERPTGIYVPRVGRSLNRPSADKVEVLLNLHQRATITECELLLGHAPIEPTQT